MTSRHATPTVTQEVETLLGQLGAPLPSENLMRSRTLMAISLSALVVVNLALVFLDLPRETVGALAMLDVLLFMALGIHVGLAMLIGAALTLWKISGTTAVQSTLSGVVLNSASGWQLSVIPTFVLMGIIMWLSGMSGRTFSAANVWFGRMPGGLAVATNFAGAGLAAGSGSTVGVTYTLSRIAIPEMLRAGYDRKLVGGSVAMSGTLGQLIPPSVLLVIYAGAAQTPVGPQLLAAIVPGIVLACAYSLYIVVRAIINPSIAPKAESAEVTVGDRVRSLRDMAPVGVVVFFVIGGLFFGIFTPTEAGAFGALAAFVSAWFVMGKKARGPRAFGSFALRCGVEAAVATASIFLMLIGIAVLTQAMALTRIPQLIGDTVVDMGLGKVQFLLVLILVYLVLGMFIDSLSMILLTLPVFSVPLALFEVDMIWFGIFVVIMAEIGMVSPPVGMLCYIVHRVVQNPEVNLGNEFSLLDIFKGVIGFIIVTLAFVGLLIWFPAISLWLPGLS